MITPLPYWNFNPVLPTVFDDSLSYLEMVSKLYKKLEETIAEVNAIDQEAIQQALDDMRNEIAKFEAQVQEQYNKLDGKYQELYNELNASIIDLADTTAASLEEMETERETLSVEDTYENFDLKQALNALSKEDKAVVELRYFEDMKLEEISEILEENVSTVKSRLYRSLKKLKVKLGEHEEAV